MSLQKYMERLHRISIGHATLTRNLNLKYQGKAFSLALSLNWGAINNGWTHLHEAPFICKLADKYLKDKPA